MAKLTRHGVKRIRQRLGLPKKAAERELERACEGISACEISGSLRRYLDKMSIETRATYRLTPAGIFVFSHNDGSLITIKPLPHRFKSTVMNIWPKR